MKLKVFKAYLSSDVWGCFCSSWRRCGTSRPTTTRRPTTLRRPTTTRRPTQTQIIIDYGRREVMSPNYPSNYPHNSHTSKTIQVADGAMIELTFLYFSLEASSSCRYDYVQGIKGSQRKNFFTLFISVGHFWSPVDQEMWQHRTIRNHEQWQQADREVSQRRQRHKERVQSHLDGNWRKWRMEEEKRS